jgi:predicted nuclease of predicted toxin-antitoxin system
MTAIEGLSIRPYLDVNIHLWIAQDLRRRGFDTVHSLELGHDRLTDDQHLRWATDHGRAIVSFDRKDFQKLAEEWYLQGEVHAGIIVSVAPPQISVSTFHRRLLAFLDTLAADDLINEIRWLDDL